MIASQATTKGLLHKPYAIGAAVMALGAVVGLLVTQVPETLKLVIIVVGLAGAVATLLNVEIGLLTIAFMTFTRFSEAMSKYASAPSIITPYTILVAVAILVHVLLKRQKLVGWQSTLIAIGAYMLVGYASILWSQDVALAQSTFDSTIRDALVGVLMALLIQRGPTLRRVIWVILAVGIFLGTISVYQYLTSTYQNPYWGFGQAKTSVIVDRSAATDYRIGGPFADSVFYAQLLLLFVPLALDRMRSERSLVLRGIAGYSLAVCVLSIMLTFSRGGFMALAVMLAFLFIRRPPPLSAVIGLVLVCVPLLLLLPANYTYRLGTLLQYMPFVGSSDLRNDDSFRGRSSEMIIAIQQFADHPILGVGLGNYNARYLEYSRWLGIDPRLEDRSAHCLYCEIGAETGLLGLAVFGGAMIFMFLSIERARKDLERAGLHDYAGIATALTAGMIGYLIAAIFLHAAFPRPFWCYYGIVMSMTTVARYEIAKLQEARLGEQTA
jgi:O-antigen ligase